MENQLHARDLVGVQDFVLLEEFRSSEAFVENLRKRYQANLIYTYLGNVVVSVNPYKNLGIYSSETIEQYRGVNLYELPPHIYAISDAAYHSMKEERLNQCVLISGESGSGKTEASKKLLQYLAVISPYSSEVERIKEKLLKSNPLLEAFGNAKTNKNDNSSRFGKYMDIQFDFKGSPIGGHIINYLLEKSRVVHQNKGEQNFHIFYQLLRGADDEELQRLELKRDPSFYRYLNQADIAIIKNLTDREGFQEVKEALKVIDFTVEEQNDLFAIVASILHVGNIDFKKTNGGVGLVDRKDVEIVTKLLGCPAEALEKAFRYRSVEIKGEKVKTMLTLEQAAYARDALSKGVYERLFTWLVARLNTALKSKRYLGKTSLLGILDIYGFEIFEENGFEQFCINYCNEKLQQLFIELTLKSEQEEYLREGIEWEPVEYFNNKIICDLIEEKHKGIVSVLDEECLRPGEVSDMTFLSKLMSTIGKHEHFVCHEMSDYEGRKEIGREEFRLKHYAGDVTYRVIGFIDKNNDPLYRDLKEAMSRSKNSITSSAFPESEMACKKRPGTAATQFKTSLNNLMTILLCKQPSYVRCIKPNNFKRPADLDERLIHHQVKYLGLMENLRVRRAGFAYRRNHKVFLNRYKALCPDTWPLWNGSASDGVLRLCEHLGYKPDEEYTMGRTKIFIRNPKTLFATEDQFQEKKHYLATVVQTRYRGHNARKRYLAIRMAVTVLASHWRRLCAQRLKERRKRATLAIRKFIKGFITRHEPTNDDNAWYLFCTRKWYIRQLAKNLPQNVLDKSWLTPPAQVQKTSDLLHVLHTRTMVRKYIKGLSPERKEQLTIKLQASEVFKGEKTCYADSVAEPFVVSRLDPEDESMKKSVFDPNLAEEETKYCISVTKYDRHGYKSRPRILIVTNQAIYLVQPGTLKIKEKITHADLKGISVSSISDNVFILHTSCEEKDKGDWILASSHVIETVTKIFMITNTRDKLHVEQASITHSLPNEKKGIITFAKGEQLWIAKGKSGNLEVVFLGFIVVYERKYDPSELYNWLHRHEFAYPPTTKAFPVIYF